MSSELPDENTLYQALLQRDAKFDGRVFVGVSTTGIFCRLSCPARKPKPENCTFLPSAADCIAAGYRACKRCVPTQPAAEADPLIVELLAALEQRPDARWSEQHVAALGYDPSTVRRSFKRQFGMTFLEMARQRRLRHGFGVLRQGGRVVDAQFEAGFESPSAFRTAFARLVGCRPGDLRSDGELLASWIATPLGDMVIVTSRKALCLLEFVDRKALPRELAKLTDHGRRCIGIGRSAIAEQAEAELGAYFKGERAAFETPLSLQGSPFTQSVWAALREIPAGQTQSYADIARQVGRPTATRAVARANGANQIALMIPCHRVIGADGSLTGYGGGLWRKQRLLDIEQHYRTHSEGSAS